MVAVFVDELVTVGATVRRGYGGWVTEVAKAAKAARSMARVTKGMGVYGMRRGVASPSVQLYLQI